MEGRGGSGKRNCGPAHTARRPRLHGRTSASGTKRNTLPPLPRKTVHKAGYALDRVERYLNPDRLCKLTAGALSTFQTKLRDTGAQGYNHCRRLAARSGRVVVGRFGGHVGEGSQDRHAQEGQGAEDERRGVGRGAIRPAVAAVPKVRPNDAPEWLRYLTGLWLSGLRLEESVALSWDADAPFAVDLSGRRPRFKIKGEAQKSGQDELLPMTPDFAEFILRTPEGERRGRVFRLNHARRGNPPCRYGRWQAGHEDRQEGGMIVNAADGKTASAHDLRRTFGTRWAKRVMPAVLRKLMRHASIETTMGYYVDLNVDEMADELWANHPAKAGTKPAKSNTSGNIGPVDAPALTEAELTQITTSKRLSTFSGP